MRKGKRELERYVNEEELVFEFENEDVI